MIITLTLESPAPQPNEPDGWQRLRRLLKALLRQYGLRCIDISTKEPERRRSDARGISGGEND